MELIDAMGNALGTAARDVCLGGYGLAALALGLWLGTLLLYRRTHTRACEACKARSPRIIGDDVEIVEREPQAEPEPPRYEETRIPDEDLHRFDGRLVRRDVSTWKNN